MAKIINPDKRDFQRSRVIKQLPAVNQTETLQKFFGATVDHLFQSGSSEPINGFIGRRPSYYDPAHDFYVPESTDARTFYQLEPAAVAVDEATGTVTDLLFYQDLVNYLAANGANVHDQSRLFAQETYAWMPPVDIDKIVNFREYFWIKRGPDVKELIPSGKYNADGFTNTYDLPALANDPIDVMVSVDGLQLHYEQDFTIHDGKVTLNKIPKQGSVISIRVYVDVGVSDIEGRTSFVGPASIINGVVVSGLNLSSGMKIRLWNKQDGIMLSSDYIVEGVGSFITLIPDGNSVVFNIVPTVTYFGDGNTAKFNVPFGNNGNLMVTVGGSDLTEGLHYATTRKSIEFLPSYVPEANDLVRISAAQAINYAEIIGQQSYTTPSGITVWNGMLLNTEGVLNAEDQYSNKVLRVSGVGTAITLTEYVNPWEEYDFKDYITIARGDNVQSPWSRSNRWFHRDVIDFSAIPSHHEYFQATRPIIEFNKDLELYQYGTMRRSAVTTVVDYNTTVVVTDDSTHSSYTPMTSLYSQMNMADSITIDGIELKIGDTILILSDADELINNRVYTVSETTHGKLRFTMRADGELNDGGPSYGEILLVEQGAYSGNELYWNGIKWATAQRKHSVSQLPLFMLYDVDGNRLDDIERYPNSDFNGNPLFGYKLSANKATKPDPELGRRLTFKSNGTTSEILFENYLATLDMDGGVDELNTKRTTTRYIPRYTYQDGEISGFYYYRDVVQNVYGNGWYASDSSSYQPIVSEYVAEQDGPLTLELPATVTPNDTMGLSVIVNGSVLPDSNYAVDNDGVRLVVTKGDYIRLEVVAHSPMVVNGTFTIPTNLQANADNREITTITRGDFYPHFSSILRNQPEFTGVPYAGNNFRDTIRYGGMGENIIQHSAPLKHLMLCVSNSDIDPPIAIRQAARDYYRFKLKVLSKALDFLRRGVMDPDTQSGEEWLSEIIRVINAGKTSEFAYYYSGVGGSGNFIPQTPSYLGLYPVYQPERFIDTSYNTPRECIRGHDGSIIDVFGDIRDTILLTLENQIYNSIPPEFRAEYTPPVNRQELSEGKFRRKNANRWEPNVAYMVGATVMHIGSVYICDNAHTSGVEFDGAFWKPLTRVEYSVDETNAIYRPMFEQWCSENSINGRDNVQFDRDNLWTWNWSALTDVSGERLPGHWRGVYQWYYDTSRPHSHPWEMLGFANKPVWWEREYGSAPYTCNNSKLWDHLARGYIADGSRQGIDPLYARPLLAKFIPVDEQGKLLDPVRSGIFAITGAEIYADINQSWKFGDMSPMEMLWTKTDSFPFSVSLAILLMKPAKFFEHGWDTLNSKTVNGQLINTLTRNRSPSYNLSVHGENGIERFGVQTWISELVMSRGQSVEGKFGNLIRNSDVRLAYKVGGYTDSSSLTLSSENFEQVPNEDVSIRLYRSPSIRNEVYSGVLIEWVGSGWRVYGYNATANYFNVIWSDRSGPATNIVLGGDPDPDFYKWSSNTYYKQSSKIEYNAKVYRALRSHTSSRTFEEVYWEEIVIPAKPSSLKITEYLRPNVGNDVTQVEYGTEFKTQADVYDFLISYQRYLAKQGWVFGDLNANGEIMDFRRSGRDFLYWSLLDYPVGNFITLSPLADTATFITTHGLVQNIEQVINGSYSLLDKEGLPIPTQNTNVSRQDDTVTIRSINGSGIYACRLYVSELEHVILLNNKTVFNDVIYDPVLNLRQDRLRLQGQRSVNWKGRMDAPGYIVTDNLLIPNFERSAENFRNLYNIENSTETVLRDRARANIGYRSRGYLDRLLMSATSQFDLYRGMIRQKGSKSAMSRILRSTHVTGGADVGFMEEWAFRVGMYGAVDLHQSLEFVLRQNQIVGNPQIIRINGVPGTESNDYKWDDVIDLYQNDERWVVKPDTMGAGLFASSYTKHNVLPTAGPVKVGDTDWIFVNYDAMLDAINKGTVFSHRDTAWVYKNSVGEYDVLRLGTNTTNISAVLKSSDSITEIGVISDDVTGSILEVVGNELLPDGVYELTPPTPQSNIWSRSFSYTDVTMTSKSFTETFDIGDYSEIIETRPTIEGVIINKSDAGRLALLRKITIRTLEPEGDNFRGLWVKQWAGTEAISEPNIIAANFGQQVSVNGVAFPVINQQGVKFHPTSSGKVTVKLNGTKLPIGSYFLSPNGHYLFVSTPLSRNNSTQYREILPTDTVEMVVESNPKISIGTNNDPQRFLALADTPAITLPYGGVFAFDIPYFKSIDENGKPYLDDDIKIFIHHDMATQGRMRITIDAVQVGVDTDQTSLVVPSGTPLEINGISVTVNEAFNDANVFGTNQLLIGDGTTNNAYVDETVFPPSNLNTVGTSIITPKVPLPIVSSSGGTITIDFAQAWSVEALTKFGFADMNSVVEYDYLTTPDEYYHKTPSSYRPGTPITVKLNGEVREEYVHGNDADAWNSLQYNILHTGGMTNLVYFGKKIQEGSVTNGVFEPLKYDVDITNEQRIYPVPGSPTVEVIRDTNDTAANNATVLPIVGGGHVSEVVITDGGSGYLDGFTEITFVGSSPARSAAATPIIINGEIVKIVVDDPGSDYLLPPSIIILDTSPRAPSERGSGAQANAIISDDGISSFVVVDGGQYDIAPTVLVSPDKGAIANVVMGKSSIKEIKVINGGIFTTAPIISVQPPVPVQAEAKAYLDAAGRLSTFAITNPGRGYTSAPNITLYDENTGNYGDVKAVINDHGQVSYINIDNKGSGYSFPPLLSFAGGSDTTPIETILHMSIKSLELVDGGHDGTLPDGQYDAIVSGGEGTPLNVRVNIENGTIVTLYAPLPHLDDYTVLPPENTTLIGEDGFPLDVQIKLTFTLSMVEVVNSPDLYDLPDIQCNEPSIEFLVIMNPRSIAAVDVVNTGSGYSGRIKDKDVLQIVVNTDGAMFELRNVGAINDGYHVINNLIYFMNAPRFQTNSTMEIVLHHAVRIAKTEDVDISTPNIEITPATSGDMTVNVEYTTVCSTLKYLSDLNGNIAPVSEEAADPFALVTDGITIVSRKWESIVFATKQDMLAFNPEVDLQDGELCLVKDNGNGQWEKFQFTNGQWVSVIVEPKTIDHGRFDNALIYNKDSGDITSRFQVWKPVDGYIPGIVDSEISYRLPYDPAYYTNGDNTNVQVDANQAWGERQVGQVWWDTSTTVFLDCNVVSPDMPDYHSYLTKYWGQVAPGTSIDCYEWVKSTVKPDSWADLVTREASKTSKEAWFPSGEAKDVTSWVEGKVYNAKSGLEETFYYFWVKNTLAIPQVPFRHMATANIANVILNPSSNDLPWFAAINDHTMMVANARYSTDDTSTVLQVNWSTTNNEGNIHKQWVLLREGDVRSIIPAGLWSKMTDSLVGWDAGHTSFNDFEMDAGTIGDISRSLVNQTPVGSNGPKLVPDPSLTFKEMIGSMVRPRQTWFIPEVSYNGSSKICRPSLAARRSFVDNLNRILRMDEVVFDFGDISFPTKTPYPNGRKVSFSVDILGEHTFDLPRGFMIDNATVYVETPNSQKELRYLATKEDAVHGVNYYIERVKVNNTYCDRIVFPHNVDQIQQDPLRFSTVTVTSGDHVAHIVNTILDRDYLFKNGRVGKGENVLVLGDMSTNGFWVLFKCLSDDTSVVTDSTWQIVQAQTYDLSDFITEIDWWADGYDQSTILTGIYSTTAHRNAAKPFPVDGDIVKVLDDGYGKWLISAWLDGTWVVVAKESHIKQLSSKFYEAGRIAYAGPGYTWGNLVSSNFNDIQNRDGSWELRVLLENLNSPITPNGTGILDATQANELFFAMVYHVHSTQYLVDWAFKTSYLYIAGYNEPLLPTPVLYPDQSDELQEYINEVKPYRVKIRDFVRRLSPPVDDVHVYMTDFDKPPMYDEAIANSIMGNDKSYAHRPLIVNPNGDGTYNIPDNDYTTLQYGYYPLNVSEGDLGKQFWNDWLDNSGINPSQPQDINANPNLIRHTKIKFVYNRVDDRIGGNSEVVSYGWDSYGWDIEPWDTNDYSSPAQYYAPSYGMWKNDPVTLIDGLGYRGVSIDGTEFNNSITDTDIDGGQYGRDLNAYDIDVDGSDLNNPHYAAGHPPELIKVGIPDSLTYSVYRKHSPTAPAIVTTRYSGLSGIGPHAIGNEPQSSSVVMVHVDGRYLIEGDDYTITANTLLLTTPMTSGQVLSITSFSVGGGTPYQEVSLDGRRDTRSYPVKMVGNVNHDTDIVQTFRNNNLSVMDGSTWIDTTTTWQENINSMVFNDDQWVGVGDVASFDVVSFIILDGNAIVETARPHELSDGYYVAVSGAEVIECNGLHTIAIIDDTSFSYPVNAQPCQVFGNIVVTGSARIITTTDLINWDSIPNNLMKPLTHIVVVGVHYVVADDSALYVSDNLTSWNKISPDEVTSITNLSYLPAQDMIVMIGNGNVYTSIDLGSNWEINAKAVFLTVGEQVRKTGRVSPYDATGDVGAVLRASMIASNHRGLSMGIYDPMYYDHGGNPIDPNDDRPYLWQLDTISILDAGSNAPNSPSDGWKVTVAGGNGKQAILSVHISNGGLSSVDIEYPGEYTITPFATKFKIQGDWVAMVGMEPNEYYSVVGEKPNVELPIGTKIIIGKTTTTLKSVTNIEGLVDIINAKTNKHGAVAENINGFLKLSALPEWTIIEDVNGSFPVGARLGFTFRPAGIPLSEGIDSLIQDIIRWKDGDLILLNGQDNKADNGVYVYRRGGVGSDYALINPIDPTSTYPETPQFVYDTNDGVGYALMDDNTYRQFIFNPTGVASNDSVIVIVGSAGLLMTNDNAIGWEITSINSRDDTNWIGVVYHNSQFIAYGENGEINTSQDGYVWVRSNAIAPYHITKIVAIDDAVYVISDALYSSLDGISDWSVVVDHGRYTALVSNSSTMIAPHNGKRNNIKLLPTEYSYQDGMITMHNTAPIIPPGDTITITNMGTVIEAHGWFKPEDNNQYMLECKEEPLSDRAIMVTSDGVICDFVYQWNDGVLYVEPNVVALESVSITVFAGEDPAIGFRNAVSITTSNVNEYNNPSKQWASGFLLTNAFTTQPGSDFPSVGTILVKKNGVDLSPPTVIKKTLTASDWYSLSPMVDPSTPIEIYVNGVQVNDTNIEWLYHHVLNTIIGFKFNDISSMSVGDDISIIIYQHYDFYIDYEDHSLILTNEPTVGDEITIICFNENTAMGTTSETIIADGESKNYLLRAKPFNDDHIFVSVSGDIQNHVADFLTNDLGDGGWDTIRWGGNEQFGEWYDQIANPEYSTYIMNGGLPPVWNGQQWVNGTLSNQPYETVSYDPDQTPYTGPTVTFYDHAYIVRGPSDEVLSWDTTVATTEIQFDVVHPTGTHIKATVYSGSAQRPPMAWRYHRAIGHDPVTTRISDDHSLILGHDVPYTNYSAVYADGNREEFEIANGQAIKLYLNSSRYGSPNKYVLPLPPDDGSCPGAVWIGSERIEYFDLVTGDDGVPLHDQYGDYLLIRRLRRGTFGTSYGVRQYRTVYNFNVTGNIVTLPHESIDVVVKINGVQIYDRDSIELSYFPDEVPIDTQFFTLNGAIITLNSPVTNDDNVTVITTTSDYYNNQYTHLAGEKVIDGSERQRFVGIVDQNSNTATRQFLCKRPGTY